MLQRMAVDREQHIADANLATAHGWPVVVHLLDLEMRPAMIPLEHDADTAFVFCKGKDREVREKGEDRTGTGSGSKTRRDVVAIVIIHRAGGRPNVTRGVPFVIVVILSCRLD